jgi:hypothetical protein
MRHSPLPVQGLHQVGVGMILNYVIAGGIGAIAFIIATAFLRAFF